MPDCEAAPRAPSMEHALLGCCHCRGILRRSNERACWRRFLCEPACADGCGRAIGSGECFEHRGAVSRRSGERVGVSRWTGAGGVGLIARARCCDVDRRRGRRGFAALYATGNLRSRAAVAFVGCHIGAWVRPRFQRMVTTTLPRYACGCGGLPVRSRCLWRLLWRRCWNHNDGGLAPIGPSRPEESECRAYVIGEYR